MSHHASRAEAFTLRNERRDFPEWHLGRPDYALWALEFDSTAIAARMAAAQRHLAPWLLDGYVRQAHITLSLCGFPSALPRHADDFGPAQLRAQLAALQQVRPLPFAIAIGGLATFSSVPYLTVQAAGATLQTLRACLAAPSALAAPDRYVPHVTVGLYADAWPMPAVQQSLDAFAMCEPGCEDVSARVSGVSLLAYTATEIGGRLRCLASYDFESGALHCKPGFPFAPANVWHGACSQDG
jgi:2'-5' RNA ligase